MRESERRQQQLSKRAKSSNCFALVSQLLDFGGILYYTKAISLSFELHGVKSYLWILYFSSMQGKNKV